MAILETHDIGKRYGRRTWALRHVDLQVPDGSITALVGPNGSGKSTLLKAWVGFEPPTEGYLTVDGIDPWKDRAAAIERIGYVPQAPSLYRELTVDEHVRMAKTLRPRFDPAIARRRLDDLDIPLDVARRRAVRRTAGAGRAGARARGPGAGPAARRAAGQPRPAGPPRVPPRAGRGRPRRRRDRAAVVARHHRHRAGMRPAARPGRRHDAPRPVDRGRHRRAPGDRRGRRRRRYGAGRAAPTRSSARSRVRPVSASAWSVAMPRSAGARPRSRRSSSVTWPRLDGRARPPPRRGRRHDRRADRLDPPDAPPPPLRADRVRRRHLRARHRVVRRRRLHRWVPPATGVRAERRPNSRSAARKRSGSSTRRADWAASSCRRCSS